MQVIKRIYRLLFPPKPLNNYELMYELMREKVMKYRAEGATIGNHCRLWGNIDAVNPHLVTIGDNVCLADQVYLITHCPVNPGPVVIGDNAWIGFRSIVLPNVIIGEGSLIGAGSVVTHDIPPYSIAAGNPAKIISVRSHNEILNTVYLIQNDLPFGKVER